jgi:hypothetical protein
MEGDSITGDFEGFFDMHIWVPSFWTLRILRSIGTIWNFGKGTGLL